MQLRALLPEVGLPTIPSLQPIPSIGSSLSAAGVALTQDLAEKSGKFFDEFDWYMKAMKTERGKGRPVLAHRDRFKITTVPVNKLPATTTSRTIA